MKRELWIVLVSLACGAASGCGGSSSTAGITGITSIRSRQANSTYTFEGTARWQLVSAPYIFNQLFASLGIYAACWQPLSGQYAVTPAPPADTFHPGQGCWIYLTQNVAMPATGIPTDASQPFSISLAPGWNMIGNPFSTSIPLSNITVAGNNGAPSPLPQAVQNGAVSPLYLYDDSAGSYVPLGTGAQALDPWRGCWIYSTTTATLLVSPPVAPSTSGGGQGTPDLGVNADLHGRRPFPPDNAWNQPIDQSPVDPNSDVLINSIGRSTHLHPDFGANYSGGPFGIPYVVVAGNTPGVPVSFDYADESDPGPYPIPPNPPIEGGVDSTGDRHVLVIDRDNWKLYELYSTYPQGSGYRAGSGAIFGLNSDNLRPAGWTSADAAGLPIFPGLVRYDEVIGQGAINHALRFTVARTRQGYISPARHFASSSTSTSLPPMGMRVRLKSSFDISAYPPDAQVILKCLKTYGMMVADNGSNWYISGAPDARWNDDNLNTLKNLTGNAFEVVQMGPVTTE